ncbi:hypothetical protein [Planctomicrobium sp. SH664]|uniref:hypothetical protein n=1 Tax=Planctomicrobium sp. SH664 TaxID=3448125 RepID=UPI003F5BA9C6
MPVPLADFLTVGTYGTCLHGSHHASVDFHHSEFGTPFVEADPQKLQHSRSLMRDGPFLLTEAIRRIVQQTLLEVASHRTWVIHAVHVRTTHFHVVVSGESRPEKMLVDFKSYCTRRLREQSLAEPHQSVWAEHGSTRYFWEETSVAAAVRYTLHRQGEPLMPEPYERWG